MRWQTDGQQRWSGLVRDGCQRMPDTSAMLGEVTQARASACREAVKAVFQKGGAGPYLGRLYRAMQKSRLEREEGFQFEEGQMS